VAVFAAVIVLFNPFIAAFPLFATKTFVIVLATTLPFAASLIWLGTARSGR
jgi:hypothetical protein